MATIPTMPRLTDAQAMHRAHPDTFEVPSDHELATLVPQDMVKVCQTTHGLGERIWVQILGGNGKWLFVQTEQGARHKIETRHVYAIWKAAEQIRNAV